MAEPQPGAPGGSAPPAGARSATAATFKVDDGSLKSLHTTFRMLIKDVTDFNTVLVGLNKGAKTLDSVQAKLAALGGVKGGAGGAAAGGAGHAGGSGGSTVTPSPTTPTGTPGEHRPIQKVAQQWSLSPPSCARSSSSTRRTPVG